MQCKIIAKRKVRKTQVMNFLQYTNPYWLTTSEHSTISHMIKTSSAVYMNHKKTTPHGRASKHIPDDAIHRSISLLLCATLRSERILYYRCTWSITAVPYTLWWPFVSVIICGFSLITDLKVTLEWPQGHQRSYKS